MPRRLLSTACRLRSVGIIIDLKEHFNPNMYYLILNSDVNYSIPYVTTYVYY